MRPRLEEEGISYSCKVLSPDLTITGNVNLLEQVFINLITNTQRAVRGRPNPEIILVARPQHGKITIEVHDNGTDIPEELPESIFVPFFTPH